MINNLELEQNLINMGADLVGFSNIKTSPIDGQSELTYAITVAVKLPDAVLKTIEERPTISYFHEYRSANALLDSITFRLARILEKQGYSAFPIPASQSTADDKQAFKGVFQHKTAARLAGLGFIGKSGLFISKEYGSKVRLATVLTNAPLVTNNTPLESMCKGCNKCVLACPAGAISGKEYVEGMAREEFFSAEKCSHNMKNYKDIGRGAVCGICIKVCPFNKLK